MTVVFSGHTNLKIVRVVMFWQDCAGSSELSLVASAIITMIPCDDHIIN